MNTWKFILATLVIFGAGVVTGGLLVTYSDTVATQTRKIALPETQKPAATPAAQSARAAEGPVAPNFLLRKEFLGRLDRELKLTTDQRGCIEKIMCEGQEHIKEISKMIEPQVQEELVETREKIRAQLSEAQQTLYAELLIRKSAPKSTNSPPNTGTTSLQPAAKN